MLRIVNYSEKAVALIGDTFAVKDEIKKLGGTFNKSLSIENNKVPGWIFPVTKKQEVESLIKSIPEDKLKSNKPSSYGINDVKNSITIDPKITHEMFANLLNKYEMLEARLNFLEEHLSLKGKTVSSSKSSTSTSSSTLVSKTKAKAKKEDSSDDELEDGEEIKPKRFLADI